GMCFVKYDVAGGRFYLGKDSPAGPAYPVNANFWTGSVAPGSGGTVGNSQCTVLGMTSAAVTDGSGSVLHLGISIQFDPAWTGNTTVYLSADDTLGHDTGWNEAGTWIRGDTLALVRYGMQQPLKPSFQR
ncbi:MAG: conserved repeat domain, partial [Bryobacterales bacterium]|nr:conserved repeat domain [Bryobacterales bacterium]